MIFGSFLRNGPPWTRREDVNLGIFAVICAVIVGAVCSESYWADTTIRQQLPQVKATSTIVLRCGPNNFIGHRVYYSDDPTEVRMGYLSEGSACLDVSTGRWTFVFDYNWRAN